MSDQKVLPFKTKLQQRREALMRSLLSRPISFEEREERRQLVQRDGPARFARAFEKYVEDHCHYGSLAEALHFD